MQRYEYLIFAEDRRLVEHGGVGGGRMAARAMTVLAGLIQGAQDDAPVTLCGRSTSGLFRFEGQVFANVGNPDLRCADCRTAYEALEP